MDNSKHCGVLASDRNVAKYLPCRFIISHEFCSAVRHTIPTRIPREPTSRIPPRHTLCPERNRYGNPLKLERPAGRHTPPRLPHHVPAELARAVRVCAVLPVAVAVAVVSNVLCRHTQRICATRIGRRNDRPRCSVACRPSASTKAHPLCFIHIAFNDLLYSVSTSYTITLEIQRNSISDPSVRSVGGAAEGGLKARLITLSLHWYALYHRVSIGDAARRHDGCREAWHIIYKQCRAIIV